ncbi:MAG: hypothetical protein U9R05_08500 [Chloroflexota bacterium]|nr:hypothetical protein [Chloroflexota bacterium]
MRGHDSGSAGLRAAGHTVRIFTAAGPSHPAMELDVSGFRPLRYERLPAGVHTLHGLGGHTLDRRTGGSYDGL